MSSSMGQQNRDDMRSMEQESKRANERSAIHRYPPKVGYRPSMVTHSGPLATIGCEPRQARKGAAAAADSSAGVWLVWVATLNWRGVRAAEGARLESVYGVKPIEGSNPSLSANESDS